MQASLYSGTQNLLWVIEIPEGLNVFSDTKWSRLAIELCRNKADGVMFVTSSAPYHASFMNPDGTNGVFCGNGVRCVAYHLAQKYKDFEPVIIMAGQEIHCAVENDQVQIQLPKLGVQSLGLNTLQVLPDLKLSGFRMNMPNPHWVIFEKITEVELEKVGKKAAELYDVEGGMNVEFVFKNEKNEWQALVYERGAGITKACGSGAMAVLCVLQEEGFVKQGDTVNLRMSGGVLTLKDLGSYLSLQGQVQFLEEKVVHAS